MTHINNLITEYQTSGCEFSFNEVYATYADKLRNFSLKEARQRHLDAAEAESTANFTFYQAMQDYDTTIGDFEGFLFVRVRQRLADATEKQTTYLRYTDKLNVDEPAATGNLPEISAIKKEQRQLLRYLLADANEKSRQALVALASTKKFSYREAGKLLGVTDVTVKNRIEKISAGHREIQLNEYITA